MPKVDQFKRGSLGERGAQHVITDRKGRPGGKHGISVSTGITMVFVPAVSTFVISRMLGGGSNLLIGDLIEMQFLGNSYNLNVGSAMSLVLMIIVLLCMSFTSSFDEDEMEGVS